MVELLPKKKDDSFSQQHSCKERPGKERREKRNIRAYISYCLLIRYIIYNIKYFKYISSPLTLPSKSKKKKKSIDAYKIVIDNLLIKKLRIKFKLR